MIVFRPPSISTSGSIIPVSGNTFPPIFSAYAIAEAVRMARHRNQILRLEDLVCCQNPLPHLAQRQPMHRRIVPCSLPACCTG